MSALHRWRGGFIGMVRTLNGRTILAGRERGGLVVMAIEMSGAHRTMMVATLCRVACSRQLSLFHGGAKVAPNRSEGLNAVSGRSQFV
jgi:hypothetical protein